MHPMLWTGRCALVGALAIGFLSETTLVRRPLYSVAHGCRFAWKRAATCAA
jgi:hypothetical protein